MMNLTSRNPRKDYTTRNSRGAQKMADHGQAVAFYMGCYHQADSLAWGAQAIAAYKWRKRLQYLAS